MKVLKTPPFLLKLHYFQGFTLQPFTKGDTNFLLIQFSTHFATSFKQLDHRHEKQKVFVWYYFSHLYIISIQCIKLFVRESNTTEKKIINQPSF